MKYIAAYHYEQLNRDAEIVRAERIPYPPEELEETHGGEGTFPKECPTCGSDELKFFRVEDLTEIDMLVDILDVELDMVYKVFHVICMRCHEDGPLEKFQ